MDNVHIVMEILKYFNFEELCIAERINPNFKSCVQSELHRLRYVNFDRMFTGSWVKIMEKIQNYCPSLRKLKNLNYMMSLVLIRKTSFVSPDPFIVEDFVKNFLILLPSLQKLTCLEIDSEFIRVFGWKNALSFVENFSNLRQLSACISGYELFDNELKEQINKVIIGHSALTKLDIFLWHDLWIDLSLCRNLTHFTLKSYGRTNIQKYEQLLTLLDVNLNLESLDIGKVSHDNVKMIEKLMRLPKLKTLSLDIRYADNRLYEDSDLPHHKIINELYFVSLQNIHVYCENFESHAKFVAFLLTRSPRLKEFSLEAFDDNLAFYRTLFDKFPVYNHIEILKIRHVPTDEVQSFICNELSKMANLKCSRLTFSYFRSDHIQKINKLRKLKFLHWSAKNAAALKMISSSSSLEGIDLYDTQSASSASIDLILDQCPNLRYFSLDNLNSEQMRKLPFKAPNLQHFRLCYDITADFPGTIAPIIDHLTYVVENLPKLRQLCVYPTLYTLLLRHEPIKHLCRRKRLSVITQTLSGSRANLIINWIHLCCQEDLSA